MIPFRDMIGIIEEVLVEFLEKDYKMVRKILIKNKKLIKFQLYDITKPIDYLRDSCQKYSRFVEFERNKMKSRNERKEPDDVYDTMVENMIETSTKYYKKLEKLKMKYENMSSSMN